MGIGQKPRFKKKEEETQTPVSLPLCEFIRFLKVRILLLQAIHGHLVDSP